MLPHILMLLDFAASATVVVIVDIPGVEWAVSTERLQWSVDTGRLQWKAENN